MRDFSFRIDGFNLKDQGLSGFFEEASKTSGVREKRGVSGAG